VSPPSFPAGFLWGAATSAFQVEGSPLADGAGPSNWLEFTHTPGRIKDGTNADVACDHYQRYPADIERMRELGLNAYRFSIAWSRVLPEGRGRVNRAGLDHYSRMVDHLLRHGIQPLVTLFHWDLPAAIDNPGAWLDPDSPRWFADYARIVFEALDDRVPMWATINEPWVLVDAGYLHGVHAPGRQSPRETALAAHHLLLAHGAAVEAYRAVGRHQIGLVVNLEPKDPASDTDEDVAAAERSHLYMNRHFLDPVFKGRYPDELIALYGDAWPLGATPNLASARQPIDFLGINYYKRGVMARDDARPVERAGHVYPPGRPYTEMNWEVYPECLARTLFWVRDTYGDIPLYVTENGAAFADPPTVIAEVLEDPERVDYLRGHLLAAHEAIQRGVDLRGYFVWSLLDNFEWSQGFSKRLGVIHVDYASQKRTFKRSGLFYRDVVRSNGAALAGAVSRS
jgi:beta-glucosidase